MSFISICIIVMIIGAIAQCVYDQKHHFDIVDLLFRPDIHYKRCSEGDAEYLRKICPKDSTAAKDRLQILLDFDYWDGKYFLLRDDNEKLYLRKYSTRTPADGTPADGITRYVLEDVENSMIGDFKKAGNRLDRLCKEKLGCGVQGLFISYKDHFEVDILINTYKIQYCLLGVSRLDAAFQMEKRSMESICAEDDSVDFDSELDDFDPDVDEVPDGYFVNEFGELELGDDPNQDLHNVGSDAWKAQQQKFTNDSLYIYHDWDIFKDEK